MTDLSSAWPASELLGQLVREAQRDGPDALNRLLAALRQLLGERGLASVLAAAGSGEFRWFECRHAHQHRECGRFARDSQRHGPRRRRPDHRDSAQSATGVCSGWRAPHAGCIILFWLYVTDCGIGSNRGKRRGKAPRQCAVRRRRSHAESPEFRSSLAALFGRFQRFPLFPGGTGIGILYRSGFLCP